MVKQPDENPYITSPDTDFTPTESLNPDTAKEQAQLLREAIRYHDFKYYIENNPVIADRTYDKLFNRLQTLEDTFDLSTPNSPTQRVGGKPVDSLPDVEHIRPMLSIDSDGDSAAVRNWANRVSKDIGDTQRDISFFCEPKFDGLSVEVIYENGTLSRAATRGDGSVGDDITENVKTIPHVPLRLRGEHPEYLAVRGEIYMPRDGFQKLNKERMESGKDPFANPRNAAAGTLRQLDPSTVAERPLSCFFFDVLAIRETEQWATKPVETHAKLHENLPNWGLRTTELASHVESIEEAIAYRDDLLDQRDSLNYEIDGVVIKVNDRSLCEELGATSRHYRWAFAYKFPPRTEETILREIIVQVGRTGRLTPVALLDPVDVGGVTVSRASLHNPAQIEELGAGIGDKVKITRAGDVIPQVTDVLEHQGSQYQFPDRCPACGSPIERDGPMAFCTGGMACDRQLVRAVTHYASDAGLDIEGLGEQTAKQLYEAKLIEDGIADLYAISVQDLTGLDGWGTKSAKNLLDAIESSKSPLLSDFIAAIGIRGVGPTVAQDLASEFTTFDAFMNATQGQLKAVEGIGQKTANTIVEFFDTEHNQTEITRLLNQGVRPEPAEQTVSAELDGLTFVFTGALDQYTRDEAQELVESHGARATSSVSGNTDYLVTGDNPGSRKISDANENDVTQIDEDQFLTLLEQESVLTSSEY